MFVRMKQSDATLNTRMNCGTKGTVDGSYVGCQRVKKYISFSAPAVGYSLGGQEEKRQVENRLVTGQSKLAEGTVQCLVHF